MIKDLKEKEDMGYCITMIDSKFTIKKENYEKALKALKEVFIPDNMTCYDYINGKKYPHFSWVNTKTVLNSETLGDALTEIRYSPEYNENGDICNVEFTGEKYGDEKVFFTALAPYIENDSYLSFEGEDGDEWIWKFNNGKVEYVS